MPLLFAALFAGLSSRAALAARPDSGSGLFAFDESDELASVDGPAGVVRVHYSVAGPNATLLDDEDGSGAPDFAEEVAATAETVLVFYEELGFLRPLSEEDMGLSDLGGSPAFDFYLVDFGGSADGMFATDSCAGGVCSGYMIMENDFAGYGYPSLSEAVAVLTSHELFHAVQAAYNAEQPVWMSEGMAVWAEHQFDPSVDDFYWFCSEYLQDTGRSLDSPPAGSVTSFSYGTALFFQFLTERLGAGAGPDLQAALVGRAEEEAVDAIAAVLSGYGTSLEAEWPVFARWNLATGWRAGAMDGYPFAAEIGPILSEDAGASLQDDNRFYPLAATYYRLEHEGGPLQFKTAEDASGVVFSLHPVADGGPDGPVAAASEEWAPTGPDERSFDLDAGGYWLVGVYPTPAEQSVKIEFCLGPDVSGCEESGDTGEGDTGPDAIETDPPKDGGCGCGGPGGPSSLLAALAGLLGARRRRGERSPSLPRMRDQAVSTST